MEASQVHSQGVSIPAAVSVFPDDLYEPPRDWAEDAYPSVIYYNKADKGGHFAAWEQLAVLGRGPGGASDHVHAGQDL